MERLCLAALLCALAAGPAAAQLVPTPPELENRIPAPLPPPPQPPVINGPLNPGGSSSGRSVDPPHLNTHSDRTTRCIQQGAQSGLSGGDLDSYTRRCANAD